MREILFRGKCKDTGEWVEGNLVWIKNYEEQPYQCFIISQLSYLEYGEFDEMYQVFPETVGQYTRLTDRNGKKIFEGDVVSGLFLYSCPVNGVVSFEDGSFGLLWDRAGADTFWAFTSICNVQYEIIGNIHDNPELMKGGAE